MLIQLAEHEPDNPIVNYQCAWSFDVMGKKESEAVPYYTRAISLGLQDEALEGALLGLGQHLSYIRTIREIEGNSDKGNRAISK